ncbi:polysaccharide deacetylase family protein [Bacillus alkalicellulosilyticus]|uniref:polysaccharide deacetylase family protein n=1 Tax=Alkalihalobacterium alkalicellulosilyticum TaxID=1912214 RepID=UPI0014828B1F|nr:polysaccharide deacetylase family protein [Bacillus alkalicellulosilyticus]
MEEKRKRVALTFDDGPHKTVTVSILDELEKRGAKATFFVLGNRCREHVDILKRAMNGGSEIANHTWNHPDLTFLTADEVKQQVEDTQAVLEEVIGYQPIVFRAPYGAINEKVVEALTLPSIMWSVDSRDWAVQDRDATVKEALTNVKDGSVILLHDMYESTAEAAAIILEELSNQDYEFVTVSELFGFEQDRENGNGVYYSVEETSSEGN